MKILILGGTGAIGIHLVELLADCGHHVYVTSRSNRNPENNITFVQGNAQELNFLQNLLSKDWDVIIDFMAYTTQVFKARVKYLCKATNQYVFLSSSRVYSNSKSPIKENTDRLLDTSEDNEYLKTDEYALTKARQENILKESGFNNWTIIRPYISYNKDRMQLGVLEKEEWLYRALKGRTIVFSKKINDRLTTLTYGLDVSRGIQALIGKSKAYGQTFHITTENSFKWEYILNIYLCQLEDYLGYKPKVLLQDTNILLNSKSPNYQIDYDRLYNREFNNDKISAYIDTSTFTSIEAGLEKSIKLFLNKPKFKVINWKHEAQKDKLVGEYSSLSEIKGFKQKIKYLLYRTNILK